MGKKKQKKKHTKGMNKIQLYFLLLLFDALIGGIWYYFAFPALNIHNLSFWGIVIAFITADTFIITLSHIGSFFGQHMSGKELLQFVGKDAKFVFVVDVAIILVVLIGTLMGWKLLRAKDYASLLKVENCDFSEDIQESDSVSNIALMDTESARIFGNREIGSLSDVVSQYEVEADYNQINIKGTPMKVSALKYASFFKWLKNRKNGVPGYVEVNPVNSDASYTKVKSGMKYVPSGYLNDNLMRHVQFKYPTKIIDGYYFEVDDEGNPYYICPCISAKIGLFNGMDVIGTIICNPVSGECKYYEVKDIPSWVDRVFDGDLCTQKYDWNGTLSGGYWNSVISQTGCKKTTDDYGYIAMNDDVWVYTGVTSLNSDQSNVGFIMVNQRTSEAKYYKVSGAEEFSAMKSAEGAVQEKNYNASFPCLINVKGQPTYIMVLKDSGGLVKMYAMVNVEQYNIVATGNTQQEVFSNYKKLLNQQNISSVNEEMTEEPIEITVKEIQYIAKDGETIVYIKSTDDTVFKQSFSDNEELILLNSGDRIKVTAPDYWSAMLSSDSEIAFQKIFTMTGFEWGEKAESPAATNTSLTSTEALEEEQ